MLKKLFRANVQGFELAVCKVIKYDVLTAGLPWSGNIIWKMIFFPGQGKVREFCGWSGKFRQDFESQGKVREFENKWLWQAVFRKFYLFCSRGEMMFFEKVQAHLPLHSGATLKGKNLLPWGANSFL